MVLAYTWWKQKTFSIKNHYKKTKTRLQFHVNVLPKLHIQSVNLTWFLAPSSNTTLKIIADKNNILKNAESTRVYPKVSGLSRQRNKQQ
jgi:hypothetical protein